MSDLIYGVSIFHVNIWLWVKICHVRKRVGFGHVGNEASNYLGQKKLDPAHVFFSSFGFSLEAGLHGSADLSDLLGILRGSMSLLPSTIHLCGGPVSIQIPRPQLEMDYHCTRNMGMDQHLLYHIWGDERPCTSYFDRQRDMALTLQAVSSPCLFIFILESDTRLPSLPSTHRRCWYLPGGFQKRVPAHCTLVGIKWLWINTYRYIFSGMNIHLPAILMFTRGTRF